MPMITIKDLKKRYDTGHITALDGVDLEVDEGDFLSIMGPSGSGKSTLLNMLGALDVPDEGKVIIDGVDLSKERDLATFRRKTVGFIFQLHNLIPSLTALENVQIPLMDLRMSPRERRRRAEELLRMVGLESRAGNRPTELSGGERQRVAIARALVNDPKILLADEPTGSVDSATSVKIMELLKHLQSDHNMTLLVVTHDPGIASQAEHTVEMIDGKLA